MEKQKRSEKIARQQKKLYLAISLAGIALLGGIIFLSGGDTKQTAPVPQKSEFNVVSQDVKPENIRLSYLETISDVLTGRMQTLEKSLTNLTEEKSLIEKERLDLQHETEMLIENVRVLEEKLDQQPASSGVSLMPPTGDAIAKMPEAASSFKVWESSDEKDERHVLFEIPAGTVVKAVLVSGADCSVAVQKPTGPNMILLRPLDHGKLPRRVLVPLKGSVIIGNAIGDMASERVYVRAERMTLVEPDGSFVETEVSAYISGEDGREGIRGVVVDRSGQMIMRAAFASFLQGVGQTLQTTLNNQTIEKMAETVPRKTLLDLDLYRNSAFQGGSTALNKLADYYIKRAEQLQPAIQIAAGRVVDIVFTKTVRVGEKDLRKRFEKERELKAREING